MTQFSLIMEALKLAKFESHAVERATHNAAAALEEDLIAGDYEPSPDNEKFFTALDAVLVDYREQTPQVIDDAVKGDEVVEVEVELVTDEPDDDGMEDDIDAIFKESKEESDEQE